VDDPARAADIDPAEFVPTLVLSVALLDVTRGGA